MKIQFCVLAMSLLVTSASATIDILAPYDLEYMASAGASLSDSSSGNQKSDFLSAVTKREFHGVKALTAACIASASSCVAFSREWPLATRKSAGFAMLVFSADAILNLHYLAHECFDESASKRK